MRKNALLFLAAFIMFVSAASPAAAVTDGTPDDAHPYVGLVVFYDASGTATHRCSGTLLSAKVFLTAGHCTSGASSAQVYFGQEITLESGYPYTGGYVGTPYTYAGYDGFATFPNTGDLGIVVLKKGVKLGTYGVLSDVGTLDSLATQRGQQSTSFTVVGYGLQAVKPDLLADRVRLQAEVQLINLTNALSDGYNIHHTNAKGTGGGTCFGDSGGPVFLPGTNIIVGVTSFGLNANCVGNGFAYRVDTAAAQEFIYSFLK
ncbi:MAG TPA: trypsin-like serine protease [Thermomicrobiales bacterium]|nr:trypsin-like serine protease [Thermomicrobiales bacterium]